MITTSSSGRFSLALEVGRPTSKAREKRPEDEVVIMTIIIIIIIIIIINK